MSHPSGPEVRIIHSLRVRGLADTPLVAAAAGMPEVEVKGRLSDLQTAGDVRYRDGRMSGWMLTPDGRRRGEELLAAELDAGGVRDGIDASYRAFLAVNQRFLKLCTDWQMRVPADDPGGEPVLNDHTDADHDAAVINRLAAIDEVVQEISAGLAALLDRFDGYGRRFGEALARVRAGDHKWFTRPMIESYHTVWFELHEDLLATLGIQRAGETVAV
ncbi:MAG TPA: transcriptional regulator [Acidimicrobiia bacterium]|nr:transcriptional regulator [Acidimicrobiia bacterium]